MGYARFAAIAAAVVGSSFALHGRADTVTLINGDKLTGKIGQVTSSQIKFDSPALGTISIDVSKVATYEFDREVAVQPRNEPKITGKPTGDAGTIKVNDKTYAYNQIKYINPPAEDWNGALVANFLMERGNTNNLAFGVEADAQLRRDNDRVDDRTTFQASYNFGQSGGGSSATPVVTDTDKWMASGKYDSFWNEKLYGYVSGKLEHDRIAELYYRVSPGFGLGYQWFETPKVKFNTEAGLTYIHEEFDPSGANDSAALRLAYNYTNQLNDRVSLFHNLEYLPAFEDPGDYLLNTDIGVRMNFTANFFGQFKVLYKRDSTPAEEALKNDVQYMVGVGWSF